MWKLCTGKVISVYLKLQSLRCREFQVRDSARGTQRVHLHSTTLHSTTLCTNPLLPVFTPPRQGSLVVSHGQQQGAKNSTGVISQTASHWFSWFLHSPSDADLKPLWLCRKDWKEFGRFGAVFGKSRVIEWDGGSADIVCQWMCTDWSPLSPGTWDSKHNVQPRLSVLLHSLAATWTDQWQTKKLSQFTHL